MMSSRPPPPPPPPPPPRTFAANRQGEKLIDRSRVCPMLIRTFVKKGAHNRSEDYSTRGQNPEGEEHLHVWINSTLRELSELIKQVQPAARDRTSRLSFAIVYPDKRGLLTLKEVGATRSIQRGPDDEKTLAELHFQAGDYLDVAILSAA